MLLAQGTEAEEAWERLQKTTAWKLRRAYSRKLYSPDPAPLQEFLKQLKIPVAVNAEAGLRALSLAWLCHEDVTHGGSKL
jgi:hypothetical protein